MSQRDGSFTGGFLVGALVGGVIGGIVGTLLTAQRLENTDAEEEPSLEDDFPETLPNKWKKQQLKGSAAQTIEVARHSLEDKIAQLNQTIDEVREQIGNVDRNTRERSQEQRN